MDGCDVVIVNFNAGPFLKDAIATALKSPAINHVFVIDNASTDGSLDLIPAGEERVTVIRNEENLGFAAGCNIGIARGQSEYVLLLNPDCQILEGAVEELIAAVGRSERVGMAGPVLLNPDGSEQAGGRRVAPTLRLSFVRAFGLSRLRRFFPSFSDFLLHQEPLPLRPIEIEAISGACMLVRRAAIAKVGLLDEHYFLHCEDLDWCKRFHQHGWSILFVPKAKVTHQKSVSSRQKPLATEWYKHKGIVYFYRKFLSNEYHVLVSYLVVTGIWMRFIFVAGHIFVSRWRVKDESRSGSGPGCDKLYRR
jgi:GT2 family glycosyltransferase